LPVCRFEHDNRPRNRTAKRPVKDKKGFPQMGKPHLCGFLISLTVYTVLAYTRLARLRVVSGNPYSLYNGSVEIAIVFYKNLN
jgi:hypothetical protein